MVFAHDGDVGDVEAGGAEHVELALQVEVEEALHGAVRGYNTGGNGGALRLELHFGPIFIFGSFCAAADGNRKTAVRGGISGMWPKGDFGDLVGGQRIEFLETFLVDAESEANAIESDFDAFVGVVAKGYLNGEDAGSERRFLGEGLLVERSVKPRLCGDGHAFMRFESGGLDGRRLLGSGECGGEAAQE